MFMNESYEEFPWWCLPEGHQAMELNVKNGQIALWTDRGLQVTSVEYITQELKRWP